MRIVEPGGARTEFRYGGARKRIEDFEAQTDLAAPTNFPPGE
jgi:hypothetical protein